MLTIAYKSRTPLSRDTHTHIVIDPTLMIHHQLFGASSQVRQGFPTTQIICVF